MAMVREFIKLVYMNLKKIADSRYAYLEQVEDGKFKNAMLGAAMGASALGGMASCGAADQDDQDDVNNFQQEQQAPDPKDAEDPTTAPEGTFEEVQATVTPIRISQEGVGKFTFKESGKYAKEAHALGRELKKRYPNNVKEFVTHPTTYVIESGANGTSEDMIKEVAGDLNIAFNFQ